MNKKAVLLLAALALGSLLVAPAAMNTIGVETANVDPAPSAAAAASACAGSYEEDPDGNKTCDGVYVTL